MVKVPRCLPCLKDGRGLNGAKDLVVKRESRYLRGVKVEGSVGSKGYRGLKSKGYKRSKE